MLLEIESSKTKFLDVWQELEGPQESGEQESGARVFTDSESLKSTLKEREFRLSQQMDLLNSSYPVVGADIERIMDLGREMNAVYKGLKSGVVENAGQRWNDASYEIYRIEQGYSPEGKNSALGIVFQTGMAARRNLEITRQSILANSVQPVNVR